MSGPVRKGSPNPSNTPLEVYLWAKPRTKLNGAPVTDYEHAVWRIEGVKPLIMIHPSRLHYSIESADGVYNLPNAGATLEQIASVWVRHMQRAGWTVGSHGRRFAPVYLPYVGVKTGAGLAQAGIRWESSWGILGGGVYTEDQLALYRGTLYAPPVVPGPNCGSVPSTVAYPSLTLAPVGASEVVRTVVYQVLRAIDLASASAGVPSWSDYVDDNEDEVEKHLLVRRNGVTGAQEGSWWSVLADPAAQLPFAEGLSLGGVLEKYAPAVWNNGNPEGAVSPCSWMWDPEMAVQVQTAMDVIFSEAKRRAFMVPVTALNPEAMVMGWNLAPAPPGVVLWDRGPHAGGSDRNTRSRALPYHLASLAFYDEDKWEVVMGDLDKVWAGCVAFCPESPPPVHLWTVPAMLQGARDRIEPRVHAKVLLHAYLRGVRRFTLWCDDQDVPFVDWNGTMELCRYIVSLDAVVRSAKRWGTLLW